MAKIPPSPPEPEVVNAVAGDGTAVAATPTVGMPMETG